MNIHHLVIATKKEIKKHLVDYLILTTAGVIFIVLINIFRGQRFWEFIFFLIFVSFYILWGFYHHIIDDTLNLKTVLEYILIAFTLIFILRFFILPY